MPHSSVPDFATERPATMTPNANIQPFITDLPRTLRNGAGLIYFDHVDTAHGYADILAAARTCGREKDVLLLDLTVGAAAKTNGNTFNPFAIVDAEAVHRLLVSQIAPAQPQQGTHGDFFQGRAVGLLGGLSSVLVWLRDSCGLKLNAAVAFRAAADLRTIAGLAYDDVLRVPNPSTGALTELSLAGMGPLHRSGVALLREYIDGLAGYNPSLPFDQQTSPEPPRQHRYVTFCFWRNFIRLANTFASIFTCETPDIDMGEVVANAGILVVRVPLLEAAHESTASLIRLVLTSLRVAVSNRISATFEAVHDVPVIQPPMFVVLSDADANTLPDFDKVMAVGRAMGVQFCFGAQIERAADQPSKVQFSIPPSRENGPTHPGSAFGPAA